jgi:hypothetical protein
MAGLVDHGMQPPLSFSSSHVRGSLAGWLRGGRCYRDECADIPFGSKSQGSQSSVRTAVFLGPEIAVRRGAAYEMPRASRARLFFPAPDHKRPQSTTFCVGTQDTLTLGNNRGASGRKIRRTIGPSGETPACKAHGRNIRESIVHSDKTPGTIPRVGVQASA